jgi:phytoene dehydrogenase-like protein
MHVTDTLEMMERAYDDWKDGRWSRAPYIDMLIPRRSIRPWCRTASTTCRCSCSIAPTSSPTGHWTAEKRQAFGDTVINTIAQHSPNFKDLILHAEIRTPWDIENEVGLTEGNIFQGELTMDQLLFNRPIPGYAQYRSPVRGVYMCGSSTHPGGGVMGAPARNAAARCCAISAGRTDDRPAPLNPMLTASSSAPVTMDWCARPCWRAAAARCWCWRRPPASAAPRRPASSLPAFKSRPARICCT